MEELNGNEFRVNASLVTCTDPNDTTPCGQLFAFRNQNLVASSPAVYCVDVGFKNSTNTIIDVNVIMQTGVALFYIESEGLTKIDSGWIGESKFDYGGNRRLQFIAFLDHLYGGKNDLYPNYTLPNVAPDGYPYVSLPKLKYSFLKTSTNRILLVTGYNWDGVSPYTLNFPSSGTEFTLGLFVNCPTGSILEPTPTKTSTITPTPTKTNFGDISPTYDNYDCNTVIGFGYSTDNVQFFESTHTINNGEVEFIFETGISPDRFVIIYENKIVADTGYVGLSNDTQYAITKSLSGYGINGTNRNLFRNNLNGNIDPTSILSSSYPDTQTTDSDIDGFPIVRDFSYQPSPRDYGGFISVPMPFVTISKGIGAVTNESNPSFYFQGTSGSLKFIKNGQSNTVTLLVFPGTLNSEAYVKFICSNL